MNLSSEINALNSNITADNIGLGFFESLKKSKPIFHAYSAVTLYRAYIMEYIILLWDNTYSLLINNTARSLKLREIGTDNLLGKEFINSTGYRRLVELQYFLEHNYFNRYSLIRYLTQAWANYLFNKQEHYPFIPLGRIYSDKVKHQYLELSKGLADKTVYQDNLSFTDDPLTIALLNYYYYLDTDKSPQLVKSFELSLKTSLDESVAAGYRKVLNTKDSTLIMHYINSVGLQRESFTASYGDTLLLNKDIMMFSDISLQERANNYLASGGYEQTSIPVTITLSISRLSFYSKLLNVICKKQLNCNPMSSKEVAIYRKLGFKVSNTSRVDVGSSSNNGKSSECS